MKKTTFVKQEENYFDIVKEIRDVAIVKSVNGMMGLLNTKTNQFIWDMDDCKIEESKFEGTIYKIKEELEGLDIIEVISIYDALLNRVEVTDAIVEADEDNNTFMILTYPDGKKHIYDSANNEGTVFDDKLLVDIPLDDVEYFSGGMNKPHYYYLMKANDKVGVYLYGRKF